MPTLEIVKAWKDEEYRDTLTIEQRVQVPEHPSGIIEFEQPELEDETLFVGKGIRTLHGCGGSPVTKERNGC